MVMIAPALLAALLVAVPVAPARGDSNVPLVHVVGWHKLGPGSPDYPAHWEYAPAEQDWAFTIATGEWVEVRLGGRCTVDGQPTVRSTVLRHGTCRGSGQYRNGA